MEHDLIAVRVAARERAASDVISLRLVSDDADVPLPSFAAGAHIDLHLRDGLTRKYSLCNAPAERGFYEIAVKREAASRGGSAHVHDALRVGDVLRVGVPLNYFSLADDDSPSVLLAAGIGITPLLAMMHDLTRAKRPFALHYFIRSMDSAAYVETVQRQFASVSNLHVGLTPSATTAKIGEIVAEMDVRSHLYFCGPAPFMDAVNAIAASRLPAAHVHYEHFSAPVCTDAAEGGEREFIIELARSKRVLSVPADQSITDVLYEHGIEVETSCEAGICGACRTAVLGGTPDHRDAFLSPADKARNDCVMPCVSRCRGERLVLDI
ncbi:PDR/VanB family oxidoreductase [Burkholderia sp. A2]|uniref:PDR/VanB family oxidoreductase n=1 Tax=Burkholderia sp. A2 TaxID=236253 RepID=UPI00084BF760|nr:PDR/VanB family oxidoreductase [Burkholderia sp. A2]OED17193.1 ferredoxin [Burkholderia sp. A2]